MDMIYNVNTMELGINDVLQLVEIVLGEGKEFLFRISLLFVKYENIELISNHISYMLKI